MSLETKVTFTCDLCGDRAEGSSKDQLPNGWFLLVVEDLMEERSFYNKHICLDCVNRIRQPKKKP